jgi:class 3 adenylate cyclase
VNESCRTQAGDSFAFRALGAVRVKGRVGPVQIFELLGRVVNVPDETLEYADRFGRAVPR